MPRPLKPYKVDDIHHQQAGLVHIMFDRDSKNFFAVLGTERVEAPDLATCRKLAIEMIPRAAQLKWEPMIEVEGGLHEVEQYEAEYVGIKFVYRRFELATRHDGQMVQREHPKDLHKLETPRISSYRAWPDNSTLLPYTEERWEALGRLRAVIKEAGERLTEIRANSNALLAVLEGRAVFLQLPEKKKKST
jgi:hypothetical protein